MDVSCREKTAGDLLFRLVSSSRKISCAGILKSCLSFKQHRNYIIKYCFTPVSSLRFILA